MEENPDRKKKKKRFVKNVQKAEIVSEIICSKGIPQKFSGT